MTRLNLDAMVEGLVPVARDLNVKWDVVNLSDVLTWLVHAARYTQHYASDLFLVHEEICWAIERADVTHDEWVMAGFRDYGIDPRSDIENRIWNDADEYHVIAAVHIYIDDWRHTVEVFNLTATDPQWVFEEEQDDDIR